MTRTRRTWRRHHPPKGVKPRWLVRTQVRGDRVATAKLNDCQVAFERAKARRVRQRCGELPLGWTANRAEWLEVSRASYEKMLYRGGSYRHLPGALTRPTVHSGRRRVWNGPQ